LIITVRELVQQFEEIFERKGKLLIAIDGCGGSGKSSLARLLRSESAMVSMVSVDDFYLPSSLQVQHTVPTVGPGFDWHRLETQVLRPLFSFNDSHYQRYDWDLDALAEWHDVPHSNVVIVEGVYSAQRKLEKFYDVTIWVDSSRALRLCRGVQRDGEASRRMWEEVWMPAEDFYVRTERPESAADIVVDGAEDFRAGNLSISKLRRFV